MNDVVSRIIFCFWLGLALPGCSERASERAPLALAFPILAQIPAEADLVFVTNDLGAVMDRTLASRFVNGFLQMPSVKNALAAEGKSSNAKELLSEILEEDEQLKKSYSLIRDVLAKEVFLVVGPGTFESFSKAVVITDAVRLSQVFGGLDMLLPKLADPEGAEDAATTPFAHTIGPKLREAIMEWLEAFSPPCMTLGAHIPTTSRAEIEGRIVQFEQSLPETLVPQAVQVPRGELKRLSSDLRSLLSATEREAFGDLLAALAMMNFEPQLVERIEQKLLGMKAELVYGFLEDRFILAFGPENRAIIPLQDQENLAAALEMGPLEQLLDKKPFFFGYQSKAAGEALLAQDRLSQKVDWVLSGLEGRVLQKDEVARIQAEAERLDAAIHETMIGRAFPTRMIGYVHHGIRFELLGGRRIPPFAASAPSRIQNIADGGVAACLAHHVDKAAEKAQFDTLDASFATLWTLAKEIGLSKFPAEVRQPIAFAEGMIIPQWQTLWSILRDVNERGFGSEGGFFLDLNEPVPSAAMIPEALHGAGRVPHVGMVASVADAEVLAEAWERLYQFATQLSMFLPAETGITRPLPRPERIARGESISFVYRLPELLGDDGPGVTLSHGFFLLGTSVKAQERLAEALGKSDPKPMNSVIFQLNFPPFIDAVAEWIDLTERSPQAAATLEADLSQENLNDLRHLLQHLASFKGLEYRRDEKDEPTESFWLRWEP